MLAEKQSVVLRCSPGCKPGGCGDAVTLDFEKAKEFLKKHVGSFGQTDEEMQILDDLEHAESEDAEEDELEDVMYDIEDSFEDEEYYEEPQNYR